MKSVLNYLTLFDVCLYFRCKIEGCNSGFTTKQCLQFHYRKSHGLTDEEMPKIQREIPYTLSAYSGELMENIRKNSNLKIEKNKNAARYTILYNLLYYRHSFSYDYLTLSNNENFVFLNK